MAVDRRGFSLIELLVAVAIFGVLAAALAHSVIAAQQARASTARWMRATQLAEERWERLRAGDRSEDGPVGEFRRAWSAAASDIDPSLERCDVSVSWEDRGPRRFVLSGLVRRVR